MVLVGFVREDEVLLAADFVPSFGSDEMIGKDGTAGEDEDACCRIGRREAALDVDAGNSLHSYGLSDPGIGLPDLKSKPHFSDFCLVILSCSS